MNDPSTDAHTILHHYHIRTQVPFGKAVTQALHNREKALIHRERGKEALGDPSKDLISIEAIKFDVSHVCTAVVSWNFKGSYTSATGREGWWTAYSKVVISQF